MSRNPHPSLEDAARRRITALAEDIAVPPALPRFTGGHHEVPPGVADLDAGRGRRPLVVAGAIAVASAAAAVAVAVQVVGVGGDGPGTGISPAAADTCGSEAARDGVVGSGTLADGTSWQVRTQGSPPDQSTFAQVGGEDVGGVAHDGRSWPGLVNEGALTLQISVSDRAALVFGEVPPGATRVRISLGDGTALSVCPVAVPGDGAIVRHFATALPPGAQPARVAALDGTGRILASGDLTPLLDASPSGGATDMTIDPRLVSLPLGGMPSQTVPVPVLDEIASGDTPDGRWSLATGTDGDHLILQLGADGGGVQGTPEQLLGPDNNWHLDKVPGGLVVWGPVTPETALVTITLTDGTQVDREALDTVPGVPVRAFAAFLPEGDTPAAIDARTASGAAVSRAEGVPDAVRLLRDDGNLDGIGVLVEPAA